jgi:allantoin racemase
MKILVLNPNTSSIVTQKIAAVVHKIARPETEAVVMSIPHGPESLESFYDEARATPYSLEVVKQANEEGYDAVVLAAFCDPGIEALKEISAIPVFGLEEASFSVALMLGNKFGILTEKKHKEAVKAREVRKHGLESRFASVRALNMGVVEIATDPQKVKETGIAVARRMIDEDGAEVIIMGCASMAGYSQELQEILKVPIIDPVAVTLKMVEGLAELGIRHSKVGLYAVPAPQKMN